MSGPDEGAAAVELGLCLTLLVLVGALVAPLPLALAQQTRLEQAAAYTARWASSVPGGIRPSPADVDTIAETAYGDVLTPQLTVDVPQPECSTRKAVLVTVTTTQGLGPLGRIAGQPTIDLSASASSCRE